MKKKMGGPRLRYPKQPVHELGAKAGLLEHIQQHLPEIPQAKMIVKKPSESPEDALRRADDAGIGWPRMFRSSAVAELDAHDGDFWSGAVKGFEAGKAEITNPAYRGPYSSRESFQRHLIEVIGDVEHSPQRLKEEHPGKYGNLPDSIPVIIAELSPSIVRGTYIRHPNQDGVFIITLTVVDDRDGTDPEQRDREHSTYRYEVGQGLERFEPFDTGGVEQSILLSDEFKASITERIEAVISWYDQIISLPDIDETWSWKVEFCLDPEYLFQFTPFAPLQTADFILEPQGHPPHLVVGVTGEEGINVRVESDIASRVMDMQQINPDNEPSVIVDRALAAVHCDHVPNLQANLLHWSQGLLAHQDVKAMRQAQVSVMGVSGPKIQLSQGDRINIVSDGITYRIKKI